VGHDRSAAVPGPEQRQRKRLPMDSHIHGRASNRNGGRGQRNDDCVRWVGSLQTCHVRGRHHHLFVVVAVPAAAAVLWHAPTR